MDLSSILLHANLFKSKFHIDWDVDRNPKGNALKYFEFGVWLGFLIYPEEVNDLLSAVLFVVW